MQLICLLCLCLSIPLSFHMPSKCKCYTMYRSTGFIMEGFPATAEELQYMTSRGRFPDMAVIMQVHDDLFTVTRT